MLGIISYFSTERKEHFNLFKFRQMRRDEWRSKGDGSVMVKSMREVRETWPYLVGYSAPAWVFYGR